MILLADEKIRKFEENELVLKKKIKQTEERFEREIEIFRRNIEESPEKRNSQEEIEKIVGKYEKKIVDILKEQEKEKGENKEDNDRIYQERNEFKRKLDIIEAELKKITIEKNNMLRKIDEKNKDLEESDTKFVHLNQEFKDKLCEIETNFVQERKNLEMRLKSVEFVDDVQKN